MHHKLGEDEVEFLRKVEDSIAEPVVSLLLFKEWCGKHGINLKAVGHDATKLAYSVWKVQQDALTAVRVYAKNHRDVDVPLDKGATLELDKLISKVHIHTTIGDKVFG